MIYVTGVTISKRVKNHGQRLMHVMEKTSTSEIELIIIKIKAQRHAARPFRFSRQGPDQILAGSRLSFSMSLK
jgi:hypothetical protein